MKKLAILFAVIGLSLNIAIAENIKSTLKAKTEVSHNGYNLVKVSIEKAGAKQVKVSFYDNDFTLLHTEKIKKSGTKAFDISALKKGHYILKITADGNTIEAKAIEKIK